MPAYNVAVVGAGYAGSAAALLLSQQGHRVEVFEAVEDPGPVGAGILLQPSGMVVLQQLGLLDEVLAHGAVVDRLRCRTSSGKTLFQLAYRRDARELYGLGLHRGVLFRVLYDAVLREGVPVHLGTRIMDIVQGAQVEDDKGRRFGPYDLIVVADGSRSQIRAADFPTVLDAPYPWGALWFVGVDEEHVFTRELFQVVEGAQKMLGFLPTGRAPDSSANLTSLFWSFKASEISRFQHLLRFRGVQVFRDEILSFEPRAEPLVSQITDADQILFASYRDVRMRRWHGERHGASVVVIGDAAHSMSPQLGQGSNLALFDALELARVVGETNTLPDALASYQRARRSHLGFYQRINRWLTPFFQSDSRILGWIRDIAFPIGSRLPFLRGAMVQTMCGIRRGFLRANPLPLPTLPKSDAPLVKSEEPYASISREGPI
ncbi:MAG: NAD(P)/FAD-dependent oxidoreductase [Myxococcota bacterium]